MADTTDADAPKLRRWKVCDNMGSWHEVVASFAYMPEGSNMVLLMRETDPGKSFIAGAFAEPAACYAAAEVASFGDDDNKVVSLGERRG